MNARIAARHPWQSLGRMGIVAGMHAALLFVVAGALVIKKDVMPQVMTGTVIDDPKPPTEPPPTISPRLQPTDLHIPEPVFPTIQQETTAQDTIDAQVLPPDGVVDPQGSADPVPVIQGVRIDPRRPLTQPAYPASDTRLGNEGTVDLEVYVLPDGRVGDARIVRSTGHPRLDQSALDEAKKNWRLLPATRDGVAIPQWHRLRVVFRLTKG